LSTIAAFGVRFAPPSRGWTLNIRDRLTLGLSQP
jgi:hypothetical protein